MVKAKINEQLTILCKDRMLRLNSITALQSLKLYTFKNIIKQKAPLLWLILCAAIGKSQYA